MTKKAPAGPKAVEPELREGVLLPFRTPAPGAPAAPAKPAGYEHIALEYPVHPRPRWLKYGKAGERLMAKLATSVPEARALIGEIAGFRDEFLAIPVQPPRGQADAAEPSWVNGWFPAFDAVMLYGLLALRNPRWFVEVGSGNSTRFARRAIRDHDLRTKIISIDPCPRAEIDAICDQVIRSPLERVDLSVFGDLQAGDILFIDSSHRCFMNSDVTVLFLEILPNLPPGVLVQVHDIFLPYDYPADWADRYYAEQYLLSCILLSGYSKLEIVLPNYFVTNDERLSGILSPLWTELSLLQERPQGFAFWMRSV